MRSEEMVCDHMAKVIIFPLHRRISTVRRAAEAILAQPTVERQDRMRHRISDILFASLVRTGLGEFEQDEAVGAFFSAVDVRIEAAELDQLFAAPGD